MAISGFYLVLYNWTTESHPAHVFLSFFSKIQTLFSSKEQKLDEMCVAVIIDSRHTWTALNDDLDYLPDCRHNVDRSWVSFLPY